MAEKMDSRVSERTRRMLAMANTTIDEEFTDEENEEPFSSDSMVDSNYSPDEPDSDSENEHEVSDSENEHEVTLDNNNTGNIETSQETTNIGSNLREESDSSMDVSDTPVLTQPGWSSPRGNHKDFEPSYSETEGMKPEFAAALVNQNPFQYFSTFVDQDIIELMVLQTNHYATQLLTGGEDISQGSRLHKWTPTSSREMWTFLGLIGYMGLVRMPTIRHYWSRKMFYHNDVSKVMSRNRFEVLLQVWHFTVNNLCPPGDRVFKVQPLVDILVNKYQQVFTPGNTFCIDESLVPFRGRLIFKQYIPLKTHKYGIKIFKLCSDEGNTWNMKIYCGKEQDAGASVPTNVVMTLSESLLDKGRTAVTDNYYTSLDLANKLLDRKTHLLGTIRSNRKGNPKEVTQKKLKRGEIIAKENERGMWLMKWRDKRDVLLLSTKHTDSMVEVPFRGDTKYKPKTVLDYNKGKSSIDLSDQMASYNTALRKTMKWYRKVAIEVLFGTSMVNAHFLYKKVEGSYISITDFRQKVYENMLYSEMNGDKGNLPENNIRRMKRKSEHCLDKKEGPVHKTRKYCVGCYEKEKLGQITKNTVKKVNTFCKDCLQLPHYCMDCFDSFHK